MNPAGSGAEQATLPFEREADCQQGKHAQSGDCQAKTPRAPSRRGALRLSCQLASRRRAVDYKLLDDGCDKSVSAPRNCLYVSPVMGVLLEEFAECGYMHGQIGFLDESVGPNGFHQFFFFH